MQALSPKEFADDFYVNPSICTLPPIPQNDGVPNLLSSSAICLDRSTGTFACCRLVLQPRATTARSPRAPACRRHPACVRAGQPSVQLYDIVGVLPDGTRGSVGQAQVFVTYQRRLYLSLKFMCKCVAICCFFFGGGGCCARGAPLAQRTLSSQARAHTP